MPARPHARTPAPAGKRGLGSVSAAHVAAAAAAHRRWLEDVILHLLCVLALDRFGDYGSDQVRWRRGRGRGRVRAGEGVACAGGAGRGYMSVCVD